MKRYVVWDWNGTLLNDVELGFQTINVLLREEGLAPLATLAQYRAVFQFPVIAYYEKVGFDFEKKPFPILAQRYMEVYQPASLHCSLYAQAETALASLHHKGKEQILLSASQLSFLKEQLAQYDISDYFSDIWGLSDYYAHSKAELAKRMIEEKGLRKEEVVFIGDSVHDYEVACSVGCTCILVAAGHQSREALLKCDAEVVEGLLGAMALIEQM